MKSPNRTAAAFSMVEVTVALGLVVFCLLALIGLLPAGLGTVRDSNDEAAAVNCMEQLASAIREARPVGGTKKYAAAAGFSESMTWDLGGEPVAFDLGDLSAGGRPSDLELEPKYRARVELDPPSNLRGTGTAMISVAWPEATRWDASKSQWIEAQGMVSTWVVYVPKE